MFGSFLPLPPCPFKLLCVLYWWKPTIHFLPLFSSIPLQTYLDTRVNSSIIKLLPWKCCTYPCRIGISLTLYLAYDSFLKRVLAHFFISSDAFVSHGSITYLYKCVFGAKTACFFMPTDFFFSIQPVTGFHPPSWIAF